MHVLLEDGLRVPFDVNRIRRRLDLACQGLAECDVNDLLEEVIKSVFDGISVSEIYRAMILAARCRIERDPAYDTVASRLLRMVISNEALGSSPTSNSEYIRLYRNQFEHYIIDGINSDRLTPDLRSLNLTRLAAACAAGPRRALPIPRSAGCLRSLSAAHRGTPHRDASVFLDASCHGARSERRTTGRTSH
ncbi:MAG UNVERIFIED_CONTAM: hypothetical protein LVR18_37165 [Planctomycetaceae bacterium]